MNSLVLVALVGTYAAEALPELRNVGGSNISISEVPYVVSVQYRGSHICGGSILTAKAILTAAHCTDGHAASDLSIRAGSSNRQKGGQVVQVATVAQHPSYDARTLDYDVAILKLNSSLSLGSDAAAIRLPTSGQSRLVGSKGLVAGWGRGSLGDSLWGALKGFYVTFLNRSACKSIYGNTSFTPNMFCAGDLNGSKDTCSGDAGAPLVTGNTLIGIISWGIGCDRVGYPGIYTNASVPGILDFIKKVIN